MDKMKLKHLIIIVLFPNLCHCQDVIGYEQKINQVNIILSEGILSIYPLTENAVRIKFSKDNEPDVPELILTSNIPTPGFQVSDLPSTLEIKVKKMGVMVDKQTGKLSYVDNTGRIFLNEKAKTRKLVPDSVMGVPCFLVEQSFDSPSDEYLFGLGQFQDGHFNLKHVTRRLTQVNSQISIPFIYSSKGYGLLWHQYGLTDFNPANNLITLKKQDQSISENDSAADVVTISGTYKISRTQALYIGRFKVPVDGVYSIFVDLGDMDNRLYAVIDGTPYIDMSNFWLPPAAGSLVHLKAGAHQLQIVCKSSNIPQVSWKLTDNVTTFRSPNARLLDYVVFYGPSADSVITTYRKLSGKVPMLPRWAYGFWQCRERYTSGKHLIETVREFRRRNLPMDVIVQDWQYWGKYGWGVMKFDESNYPDPAGLIRELHSLNAHFSISVWENPDKKSDIGKDYTAKNLFIPESPWLDVFNPLARKTHWDALNQNLFRFGVDSWWMDATEPENDALKGKRTFIGLGDFYRLTYPLFVSQAVYEGQRHTTSEKRVCILTRSAFLGQQKYGTINWSGDIGGTWKSYKRQIVAGLNYTITGLPYWTTDIGGFFRPGPAQYTDENYRELLTRWYQWGVFNPIFRIHGYQSETEPWNYGDAVEANMRSMLDLRYRLMPYIYSEAWQITKNGSTMMRPLVMDFNGDTVALNQQFEYMFGKALLVAPITEPGINELKVYLPKTVDWYDFWTGKQIKGGGTIITDAPLQKIPLFVKTGSIIPMGPFIQYSTEKTTHPIVIRIYPGADGEFTLYEDENDNYNYEKGIYATITFTWNDPQKVLTIHDRKGAFPGMLKERTFGIVMVTAETGTGINMVKKYNKLVTYKGKKITVNL
jgi:alpha-D-xyloside xylohydrolase